MAGLTRGGERYGWWWLSVSAGPLEGNGTVTVNWTGSNGRERAKAPGLDLDLSRRKEVRGMQCNLQRRARMAGYWRGTCARGRGEVGEVSEVDEVSYKSR